MTTKYCEILEGWLDGVPFFIWSHFNTIVENSSDNPNGVAEGEAPFIVGMGSGL